MHTGNLAEHLLVEAQRGNHHDRARRVVIEEDVAIHRPQAVLERPEGCRIIARAAGSQHLTSPCRAARALPPEPRRPRRGLDQHRGGTVNCPLVTQSRPLIPRPYGGVMQQRHHENAGNYDCVSWRSFPVSRPLDAPGEDPRCNRLHPAATRHGLPFSLSPVAGRLAG